MKFVVTMALDELTSFDERTFKQWDGASPSAVRIAIDRRRKDLAATQRPAERDGCFALALEQHPPNDADEGD